MRLQYARNGAFGFKGIETEALVRNDQKISAAWIQQLGDGCKVMNQIGLVLYRVTADDIVKLPIYVRYIADIIDDFRAGIRVRAVLCGTRTKLPCVEHIEIRCVRTAQNGRPGRPDFESLSFRTPDYLLQEFFSQGERRSFEAGSCAVVAKMRLGLEVACQGEFGVTRSVIRGVEFGRKAAFHNTPVINWGRI